MKESNDESKVFSFFAIFTKLQAIGFDVTNLTLYSCLSNRKQNVYIDDEFNSSDKIIHGVPQVRHFAGSFLASSFITNKTDIKCYAEGSTF